jgi:hypothetical protein
VLAHVLERLLDDPEHRHLLGRRQPSAFEVEVELDLDARPRLQVLGVSL